VVTGRCPDWVGVSTQPGQRPVTTWIYKSEAANTIQINHQPDATIFQFILTFIYSSTCFGRFPAHHQELNDCSGSLWFLSSYCGDSRAVFVVGSVIAGCHHDTKVKPEVATAVIELLMMGGKTPETC